MPLIEWIAHGINMIMANYRVFILFECSSMVAIFVKCADHNALSTCIGQKINIDDTTMNYMPIAYPDPFISSICTFLFVQQSDINKGKMVLNYC